MDRGTEGRIALFGRETQQNGGFSEHSEALRREVGVIFQQFNLITRLSLLTNVLAGRLGRIPRWRGTLGFFPKSDRVKALLALERVGLIEQAHQRASTLSGGQQQRGAIARVLTQEAKLILADVSLHQIDHAFQHCDHIIALKDGQVIHNGPTGGITPEDIAHLYGVEAGSLDLVRAADKSPGNGAPAGADQGFPGNGLDHQEGLAARAAANA